MTRQNSSALTSSAAPRFVRKKQDARAEKEFVKNGLAVVMGALVVTGFMRTPRARSIHMATGVALIGLSIWHHRLYQSKNGKNA
jgi:hypothetical protein